MSETGNGNGNGKEVSLEALQRKLADLEAERESIPLPEASGIAWTEMFGWGKDSAGQFHQVKINVTARSAVSAAHAVRNLLACFSEMKEMKIFPYQTARPSSTTAAAATPAAQETTVPAAAPAVPTTAPAAPATAPTAAAAPAASNVVNKGTGLLKSITIDANMKATFEVDGLRYPLKDSRGAAMYVTLFDPALGWSEAHFARPVVYTPNDYGTLFADWIKKTVDGKTYYDVVLIHT